MSFLAPALLIGLLAAAIPPIIHLIFRRKPKVVRFPALEFIRRSQKKTMRRFRMKQILLMLVRSLLMALVAFAVARPFLRGAAEPTAALEGAQGGTVVFVVDASWPMAYRLGDESLLDRARDKVENLLDQFSGQAALVIAGDRVEAPVGEPTGDFAALRKAMAELKPGHRADRLAEGMARAFDLVDEAPPGPRRVVVLTTAAGAARPLPEPPPAAGGLPPVEVIRVDAADGAPVPNRAIVDVKLSPAPQLGAGQWRVDARVASYADEPVQRLPVHLEVDGRVQVRGFLDLGPGQEATKTFYTRLDAKDATPAAVVLEGDALEADDTRRFWLQPAPRIRLLAVNGDPRPTPQLDELFFLERALSPETAAGARVELTVRGTDVFEDEDLDAYDVVVLANVGELSPTRGRALDAFVRAGGGLLVTMGDRVKPQELNAALGPLLPRTLRDVRAAGDAAALDEGGDRRSARLSVFDRSHPILRPFGDPAGSLGRARVGRYMLLDPAADAAGVVVMATDDGAPFLLTRTVERGRVALLTGTLDRDWGDLPIRPAFLPLVQQIVRYLTRVADMDTTPVLVGQTAPIPVEDPRVRRVSVQGPDGTRHLVERPTDPEAPWVFEATALPGYYQVTPDPPLPGLVALPGFAVAVDPAVSDLRGPRIEAPAAGEADTVRAALAGAKRTELWHAALLVLFVLLLAEGALLFRRKRTQSAA
ncbi:MAG: BatA domain-containing protein [Myxococcales bacterium]|nr:BatA domain-containing protein [Myxococcales bacterium]